MMTFEEATKQAKRCGFAMYKQNRCLYTAEYLSKWQEGLAEINPLKHMNFWAAPYWIIYNKVNFYRVFDEEDYDNIADY